jgi:hypothetical protein
MLSLESLKGVKRGVKKAFGYASSPSPSPERDESVKRRAASPPQKSRIETEREYAEWVAELARIQAQQEEMNQASMREEAKQFKDDTEVNEIINSLNGYLEAFFQGDVNVDTEAPNIRYFVGMIVKSKNVGQSVAERLARSKPLLRAVANFIVNRARRSGRVLSVWLPIISNGLVNSGRFLGRVGMASGRAAYGVMSSLASSAASGAIDYVSRPEYRRAESPQRGMQSIASRAYDSITTGLPLFYTALYNVLRRVSSLLLQCGSSVASVAAAGAMRAFDALCATPQQAVDQAVDQIDERKYECSICMTDARGLGAVLTRCKHRFHVSCITPWLVRNTTCPNCRQLAIPISSAQAGGGSRKTRSRSKTRRLRKSRSKPRKSYKSKKSRCSSRRK